MALTVLAGAGLASAAVAAAPARPIAAHLAAAQPGKPGDFNGDGYRDLAVGAPEATIGKITEAGAIAVSYGSRNGLDTANHVALSQDSAGVPGVAEKDDHFGSALAVGDFDADGYSDLAIGASGEDVGTAQNAGSLTIVFGSRTGLSARYIAIGKVGGGELTAGDFNKDGRTDFATATRDDSKIWVVYGTRSATPKPVGISIANVDSLAAGDVTGDGYADLAVSWWFDDPADQGTTSVFAGSAKGLGKKVGPTVELGDTFKLAVGDVTKDGKADVVVGGYSDEGYHFFPGTKSGMDEAHGTSWTDGSSPVAVGDIDGDGYADVAAQLDSPETDHQAVVTVRFGGPHGLSSRTQRVKEKDLHITPNYNHAFGDTLAITDLNGDGRAELVAGVAGLDDFSGAIAVVPAGASGLDLADARLIKADTMGISGTGGRFGSVLP
jgi:predicted RNA-binding protein with TRAM domain